MKISVKAYAKINLFLDITALRSDKYHDILSLMQSVSLYDTVTVEYLPSKLKEISVFCDVEGVPCDKTNLAYRAAEIFPTDNGKIIIHIQKSIPMAAGLAGGSSDAAATMVALNVLTGNKLSGDELKSLGAKLGADVPFCIEGGACIARGIGERLDACDPMPEFPIVLAKKGEGMSTPAAYKALDLKYNNFINYLPNTSKLNILQNSSSDAKTYCIGLYNIFEDVVESERPAVTELKRIMLDFGASGAMMSGSGTSVFGIFSSEDDAKNAISALQSVGAVAHLCYPCDNSKSIGNIE